MWPEKVTFNIYKSTTYSPKYLCLLFDMKISMKVVTAHIESSSKTLPGEDSETISRECS